MSKTTVLDKIENPDIPGLEEQLAAPPPPPPPPPIISVNPSESVSESSDNLSYASMAPGPYVVSPIIEDPATPAWWVPNETDSDVYNQWYESAYKAALHAAREKDILGKQKTKYLKRKHEVIDPKTDAERVANAQKELSALMKPLKCDLCNAVMNSTLQAKLHYQGKPHQKKVSMYLNQSAKKTKVDEQVSSTTSNDWNTYCDVCKIWFTSQTDANQHYAGKKHLKAAFGTKTKSNKKCQPQSKIQVDPTGVYGIGLSFHPEVQTPVYPLLPTENPAPIAMTVPPIPQYAQPPVSVPTPYQCNLCGITANRQDQLDTHKKGSKHLKMMKLHGIPLEINEMSKTPGPIDYSIYRTPSGQYYCAPCNLSLNSEITFAQHMESKKHKGQLNPKQSQTAPQPVASATAAAAAAAAAVAAATAAATKKSKKK